MFSSEAGGDRLSTGMLRGVLIGFGVASMFGMPSQSVAIMLTFWVFVFWLGRERTPAAPRSGTMVDRPRNRVIASR